MRPERLPTRALAVTLGVAALTLLVSALLLRAAIGDERPEGQGGGGLTTDGLPPSLASGGAPRIVLRDARGELLDTEDLRGRPYAVTFLYTRCPDVCPLIAQEIRVALERLGATADRVAVLAVSVDPRGDTPEAARRYLDGQRLPPSFRYLLGTRRELAPIWEAYYATPQLPGDPETSTHSAAVWLVDADGRVRGRYSAGIAIPPDDLARDLQTLLDERSTR